MSRAEGEIDRTQRAYWDAFAKANPGKPLPELSYERGWWVFWSDAGGQRVRGVRQAELLQMIERLRKR